MVFWEPGLTVECVLCGKVRGGDVPPGRWTRHYGRARRRIPIFNVGGSGFSDAAVGYMEYVHE